MLMLYKRVILGGVINSEVEKLSDLNVKEYIVFIPLIILTILLGIYPSLVTDLLNASVINLIGR